jgi:hypothetical protein
MNRRPGQSHRGSTRQVAARRRVQKERDKLKALSAALEQTEQVKVLGKAVKIIAKDVEEAPTLAQILAGEVKARLMIGGKFASAKKLAEEVAAAQTESNRVIRECNIKLKGLGGR